MNFRRSCTLRLLCTQSKNTLRNFSPKFPQSTLRSAIKNTFKLVALFLYANILCIFNTKGPTGLDAPAPGCLRSTRRLRDRGFLVTNAFHITKASVEVNLFMCYLRCDYYFHIILFCAYIMLILHR